MNWDAVGAIALLAGAAGVSGLLVYVALQIRRNTAQLELSTRALQESAYQELRSGLHQVTIPVAQTDELAGVFQTGLSDFDSLSETQQFRFHWVMGGIFNALDDAHYQHEIGLLASARWEACRRQLGWYCALPGVKQWWRAYPTETLGFSEEFVGVVEAELR